MQAYNKNDAKRNKKHGGKEENVDKVQRNAIIYVTTRTVEYIL